MSGRAGYAQGFRDLSVYQKSRSVQRRVFTLSETFPKEETYSLTNQIRRSSRSIGAQIAEAWAKRRYLNHFISKLTDADAEQHETQHWVETSVECDYLACDEGERLLRDLAEVGYMIHSMIEKADRFCGPGATMVREDTVEYCVITRQSSPDDDLD